MPLVSPIDIAALSSPIPIPENTGGGFDSNTQQNYIAMAKGSGVLSPIGSGNTTQLRSGTTGGGSNMDLMPSQQFNSAAEYGSIEGEALESGGANVGGLVKTEQEVIPTDIKFATQEDEILDKKETQYDDQVSEYDDAFKGEGEIGKTALGLYDKAKDVITDSDIYKKFEESKVGQKLNEFKETGIGQRISGLGQTIDSKIKEKIEDRTSGMSGARMVKRKDRRDDRDARKDAGLKGKEKRLARKAQRKNRKSAFKDFKDNLLDDAYVDITNLEN